MLNTTVKYCNVYLRNLQQHECTMYDKYNAMYSNKS